MVFEQKLISRGIALGPVRPLSARKYCWSPSKMVSTPADVPNVWRANVTMRWKATWSCSVVSKPSAPGLRSKTESAGIGTLTSKVTLGVVGRERRPESAGEAAGTGLRPQRSTRSTTV